MSPRRRRRSPRRGVAAASGPRARLPSRQTLLALLLFVLAGLGFGAALAPWALATLAQPTAVDEGRWTVLVPGMDEKVMSPNLGRGSQIAAGRLTLVPHSFGRADRLLPRDPRPLSRLEIDLDPRSGPLVVNLVPPADAGAGILNLKLRPGAWSDPSGKPVEIPKDEAAVLLFDGGKVLAETPAGPVALATQPAGSVELSAHVGPAFLRRFRALDTQGELVLEEDWSQAPLPESGRLKCALGGGLLGLLVGAVALGARRRDLGLLLGLGLLLPALLVLLLPHALWLNLVERLFLVRTSTWELAGGLFGLALLPLLGVALLRSGLFALGPPQRGELPWPVWVGAAVVVTAAGARGLDGPVLFALPLGVAFLCLPLRLSQAAGLSRNALLVRDLPTFAAIALLGWSQGLLPALLWRLLLILGLVPALVHKAPRAGTDLLFLTLLLLPFSAELAVRSGYLERGWSVEHLSGAELGAGEDATGVVPYWSAGCGEDRRAIWWFGGSSAGGAYQLGGEPEAFFPGQVHAALCAQGLGVETVNYANGGRDSYTFSRAIDALLAEGNPDLVVVYVGVNDILTENSSKTRKQREVERAARTADSSLLAGLAARSRLISGLSLLARPVTTDTAGFVPAVPVADAEENLRLIIEKVHAAGGTVLLLPELTRPTPRDLMADYRRMEAAVGAEAPGAAWLDVVKAMAEVDPEAVFVDRNHLSRTGHAELAGRITPQVRQLLAPAAEGGP